MDKQIDKLLNKINYDKDKYDNFSNSKIEKIVINEEFKTWNIYITNDVSFLPETIILLENKLKAYVGKEITIKLVIKILKENYDYVNSYYEMILKSLNNNGLYLSMFGDRLVRKDTCFVIELYNKSEEKTFGKIFDSIKEGFINYGYTFTIDLFKNKEKALLIKEEIDNDKKVEIPDIVAEVKEKEVKKKKVGLFSSIKEQPIPLKEIDHEDNNIVVLVKIFGIDFFESSKTNFKIITLKITDLTTSMLAKVFCKDEEEYSNLKKQLKVDTWVKIKGYTKNDNFAKDLVLNVRNVELVSIKENSISDQAIEKRVELHAHTMMSQMDGVIPCKDLIMQARAWGHKAIAITDHNGVQSFPDAFHVVNDINKNLKDNEEPFKVIYGAELLLIDDTIDVVKRATDTKLLDNTYVVFDLETTGFNAGGIDTIIEIGAVKIKDGEILEKYDELINPGRPLPIKITEITGITDNMLQDCPTEEDSVRRFKDWIKDLPLVAHNAKFDTSFLEMAYKKYNLGELLNPVIDTLELSRTLDTSQSRHSLSHLVKRYNVEFDEDKHHRGDYDAEATALVFYKMLKKLDDQNIEKMSDLVSIVSKDQIHKFGRGFHCNVLVKNKTGLKNLFKIISLANTKYLYKTPRILRSELVKYKEGLLIGSGCYESEVFIESRSKADEELTNIISFYDYIEVQPLECYSHLIEASDFSNVEELKDNIMKIIRLTRASGKYIVATGDVHHLSRKDKIYREIIVNQKVPGGGRHPLARYNIKEIPSMHFRTTDEMLNDFSFLDDNLRKEIVIDNPNKISDLIEIVEVVIDTKGIPFSPKIENSEEIVKDIVYTKAHELYGEILPEVIAERINQELTGIIKGGFDVIYLIAQKLVKKSNDDGYLVGSRGSVGSSFVATLMGITEVNPLAAHYRCPNCKKVIFNDDEGNNLGSNYSSGYDLPDKKCPLCNTMMNKDGQDIPFATFLGFDADKVPDIDLNFSGDYQWKAHEYTKELFGIDNVYRAGTIGTVADKTAFGYVKGYFEDKNLPMPNNTEIERLAVGCTGVKRTTGQHPGGIVVIPNYMDVFDFTPYQYPADDNSSLWRTTHFDYHAIDQDVLKLDILGHDDPTILKMLYDLTNIDILNIPMDDKKVLSLLQSPDVLGITSEMISCPTGTLGIPELGTNFVINMLTETKPTTFGELVKISGLSHGTDVWAGNASELIKNNICEFKEVIGCRDDIMVYLSYHGLKPKDAFKIMEFVRKGKPSKDPETWKIHEQLMRDNNIVDWYISSCKKIKYMFPKAHACAYVMSALRIAWFKVYYPLEYYASYFSVRSNDFDIDTMINGYESIKERLEEIKSKGYDISNKESSISDELDIALEMTARGYKFGEIDLYKSDYKNFIIDKETSSLIPPFRAIDGLGTTVAKNIVLEREKNPFLSIEDLQKRAKISTTLIDKMRIMGILKGMQESSQLTLF